MLTSNVSLGGIWRLDDNRLGKSIKKMPRLEPTSFVEVTRCLVCAFVDDSGIFHAFGCHLPHGGQHECLAQTPTAVVWVGTDWLEKTCAIHLIVPGHRECGERTIGCLNDELAFG